MCKNGGEGASKRYTKNKSEPHDDKQPEEMGSRWSRMWQKVNRQFETHPKCPQHLYCPHHQFFERKIKDWASESLINFSPIWCVRPIWDQVGFCFLYCVRNSALQLYQLEIYWSFINKDIFGTWFGYFRICSFWDQPISGLVDITNTLWLDAIRHFEIKSSLLGTMA